MDLTLGFLSPPPTLGSKALATVCSDLTYPCSHQPIPGQLSAEVRHGSGGLNHPLESPGLSASYREIVGACAPT